MGFVGSSVAASEADIELMLAEIGPGRDVVMATIQHQNAVWEANWNQALRNVAARHPALHVVEWQAEADQHPSWWGGDGVHLSPTGYRVRSQALVDGDDAVAGRRPGGVRPGAGGDRRRARRRRSWRWPPPGCSTPAPTGTRLAAGAERAVDLAGVVPAGATAAVVNLTVDGPAADGYLTRLPVRRRRRRWRRTSTTPPAGPGARRPPSPSAPAARLCVRSYAAADVIVDVSGAYVPGDGGSRFAPPRRRACSTPGRAAARRPAPWCR